jgi:hypothetical protein
MNSFVVLIIIGIVLLAMGKAKQSDDRLIRQKNALIMDGDDVIQDDVRIVYKYLPRDIDTFYRVGDQFQPSKLYSSMFVDTTEDIRL